MAVGSCGCGRKVDNSFNEVAAASWLTAPVGAVALRAFPVQRAEQAVADRVGDIEVVTRHQRLVVMQDVIPAQAAYDRQPTEPGLRIHVVGEVEQLVVQVIKDRREDEQETDVRRYQEVQDCADGNREETEEEQQQDRREQHGAVVARRVEADGLVSEERVMFHRVPLEDAGQKPRLVMHGATMAEILGDIAVKEGQRDRQPFDAFDIVQHCETHRRNQAGESNYRDEMHMP